MVLGDLVSDESPLLDLYMVVFSLYLPMVGGVRELSGASFFMGANPLHEGSSFMT